MKSQWQQFRKIFTKLGCLSSLENCPIGSMYNELINKKLETMLYREKDEKKEILE